MADCEKDASTTMDTCMAACADLYLHSWRSRLNKSLSDYTIFAGMYVDHIGDFL
jgi:hypothetical protein